MSIAVEVKGETTMLGMIQEKAAVGDSESIKTLNILRGIGFNVPKEEYPQSWKQYGESHYKLLVEMSKKGDIPSDCENPVAYLLSMCYGEPKNHRYRKSTGR